MPEGSFQGLTHLSVEECHSLKYILPSNVGGLLQNLEEIQIRCCDAMETIIYFIGEEAEDTSLLPRCKLLTVASCPKLKSIFSFCVARHLHLEKIKIHNSAAMETIIFPTREEAEETSLLPRCRLLTVASYPKLKSNFSFCVARHLHKLEKLSISHCHGLRQVFGNGDESRVTEHQCLLPELKYLNLVDLKCLTRFDQDNLPISGPLQEIEVFLCPNLTRLPLQTVSALKFIRAEDIWFRNLELEDESQASILKPYFQATPVSLYWGINEKLHSLRRKIAGLWLDDYDSQLEGTTQFRRLLSSGYLDDMPIWDVDKSGVVPCLVEFLTREDHTQLQSEAAWVLAIFASRSSDHTKLVIKHGALPIFVKLLCSPNGDIRKHAIWALGKIASHSPEHGHGVLIPLLAQLKDCNSVSMLSNALRSIYNIFATKPQPPFKQMKLALPSLQHLIYSNDEGVCSNACRALSCLLDGTSDKIKAVTEAGVFTQLMDLLTHPSPLVLISALHAVGNIVCRDKWQTPCNMDRQALLCLLNLLTHHDVSIKKDACHIVSNITSGSMEWIQLVIEAKIIAPLVQLLETAESDVKKEAARAILNATFNGSQEHVQHFVEQGCIKPFCDLLQCSDSSIVVLCLKGLFNILKVGETAGLGVLKRYVQVIDDSGGFKNITDHLQGHHNVEIQMTVHVLQEYHFQCIASVKKKYIASQGDVAEASFQTGNSESQCVEKGFLRSTELENPASDRDSWSKASAEQYTFKVGPGTNSNRPLLRPKAINKNASKIGLVKNEKRIIAHKDYGITGADDPSCMTSLGNAKIDNNSRQSSSTELAEQSHITETPEQELHLMETWRNFFMKMDLNSLPSSSTELEKESHVSQMPE